MSYELTIKFTGIFYMKFLKIAIFSVVIFMTTNIQADVGTRILSWGGGTTSTAVQRISWSYPFGLVIEDDMGKPNKSTTGWGIIYDSNFCGSYASSSGNNCFAVGTDNNMHINAIKTTQSDGIMFVSQPNVLQGFSQNITVQTTLSPICVNLQWTAFANNCLWNVGIWSGEGNYRAIGVRKDAQGNWFATITMPANEVNFDGKPYLRPTIASSYVSNIEPGANPSFYQVVNFPVNPGSGNIALKLIYSVQSATEGRWDYFVNNTWIAGHSARDTSFFGGGGRFIVGEQYNPNSTYSVPNGVLQYSSNTRGAPRVVFGGYTTSSVSAAGGYFTPISVTVN